MIPDHPAGFPSGPSGDAADRSQVLAIENDLWEQVLENPENPAKHNAYFTFVTRNNLLKEGSRRYGAMVGAKDDYTIEARRQFRQFQKAFVNLMFLGEHREIKEKKRSTAEYIFFFMATMGSIFGFFMLWYPKFRLYGLLSLIMGLGTLGAVFYLKSKSLRNAGDETERFLR